MRAERDEDDSSALAERFLAGSADALAEVYDRWSPLIYTYALRRLDSVDRAEEVTRQVFTEAWGSRQELGAAGQPMRLWLLGLARRSVADQLSRPTGRLSAPGPGTPGTTTVIDTSGTQAPEPTGLADRLVVADAMSRLDPTAQGVLRLALIDGLSRDQIAAQLHLSANVVQNHLSGSLVKLRQGREMKSDAC